MYGFSHHRAADGEWCAYSFGGYHADDDERTVLEADNSGGPFFKSTPIDVHRFEMGKPHVHVCMVGFAAVLCMVTPRQGTLIKLVIFFVKYQLNSPNLFMVKVHVHV